MFRLSLSLLLAGGLLVAQNAPLNWMPVTAPKIDVAGLPWYQENHGEFWRLPARAKDDFPKAVWNLALDSTGGRIRFRTDSSTVALRLEWPHPPGMRNMHAFGQSGVDLYVRDTYWGTAVPDKDATPGKVYEHVYFRNQPRVMRDITVYLSLYSPVKVLEIGLDKNAAIALATPFATNRPLVFYGTSITQGGCAS